MINKPTEKQLNKLPKLYTQENIFDPMVRMKFFFGGWTWYIIEFDGKDTFFGWVINDSFPDGAELGYVNFNELKSLRVRGIEVDRDLHFTENVLSEVNKNHNNARGQ